MSQGVKRAALKMMRAGKAAPTQIASLAGVARLTVYRWCAEAELDWEAAQARRLAKDWEKACRTRMRRAPSKAEQRTRADEAKVAWDQRHENGT